MVKKKLGESKILSRLKRIKKKVGKDVETFSKKGTISKKVLRKQPRATLVLKSSNQHQPSRSLFFNQQLNEIRGNLFFK